MVEDDLELQKLYQEVFSDKYNLVTATSGPQALSKFKQDLKPDLVILDIMLPGGMNGFDILRQLKEDPKTAKIPVIMLTNLDSEKESSVGAGADAYLVKTNVSIDQVTAKVEQFLGR